MSLHVGAGTPNPDSSPFISLKNIIYSLVTSYMNAFGSYVPAPPPFFFSDPPRLIKVASMSMGIGYYLVEHKQFIIGYTTDEK